MFLEHHMDLVTLKTGVMAAENSVPPTGVSMKEQTGCALSHADA